MASFLTKLDTLMEDNFTKKEKEIILFIRKNLESVRNMNIEALAQSVNTGYSAIYGLLKKLGINGYRNFIVSVSSDIEMKSLNLSNDDKSLKKKYFDIINQNSNIIDENLLKQTVSYLTAAHKIYIVGMGTTRFLAQSLALQLNNYGFLAIALDEGEEDFNIRTRYMTEHDLVIAFSLFGNNEAINKGLKSAKENNAKIIVISGKGLSSSGSFADITHVISSPIFDIRNTDVYVDKLVPWMFFTDKLINEVLNSGFVDREYVAAKIHHDWN